MAKKEKQLTYLQVPLPQGQGYYKAPKVSWSGLNRRNEVDTGELSAECNISTAETPYLTVAPKPIMVTAEDVDIITGGVKGTDFKYPFEGANNMMIIDGSMYVFRQSGSESVYHVYIDTLTIKDNAIYAVEQWYYPQEIYYNAKQYDERITAVSFNVNSNVFNATQTGTIKRIIIPQIKGVIRRIKTANWYYDNQTGGHENKNFPLMNRQSNDPYYKTSIRSFLEVANDYTQYLWRIDSQSSRLDPGEHRWKIFKCELYKNEKSDYYGVTWTELKFDEESDEIKNGYNIITVSPEMPYLKYSCTAHGRLFGVDKNKVYASSFNDYTNWELDSMDDIQDSHAWTSTSQANTAAGGDFTGIVAYQNHVVCFKQDFCHEITGTKNPFRINDVFSIGTIDNRSVQEVAGLLIFCGADGVYVYSGAKPNLISYKLGIDRFTYAVAGTDGRYYYLYCEDGNGKGYNFVYDTQCNCWSERAADFKVQAMAYGDGVGMYALGADGYIYRLDGDAYGTWSFETDLMARSTASGYTDTDIKHIRKVQIMADVAEGADFKVYALYNGEKYGSGSQLIYDSRGKTGKVMARVKLRRSANWGCKLHFEGSGFVRIYEMEQYLEKGGELYK